MWTATLHRTTPAYFNQSFTIGDIYLRKAQVYGCAIAIGVLAILYVIMRVTWLGRAIRAVSANMSSAKLVGVNPSTVAALTFAIGVATTGAGGVDRRSALPVPAGVALPVDLAPARDHRPRRDGQPSGRSRRRAHARRRRDDDATYISPQWATMVPWVVILVVLLVRPQGLMGHKLREDVAL